MLLYSCRRYACFLSINPPRPKIGDWKSPFHILNATYLDVKKKNLVAKMTANCYLCNITYKTTTTMQIVSTREFRTNFGKFLSAANNGQALLLHSRYGDFKITPVTEDDDITTRITRSLEEVKQIREHKLPRRTINDMLNEL